MSAARTCLILFLAAALSGCGPKAVSGGSGPVASSGQAMVGGPFQLVDQDGRTVDQRVLNGKWSLVFFGYTYCPDVCPTTLQVLAQAKTKLGDSARGVQVVFVSVDPERDTPELLAQYVPAVDARFLGLYGTSEVTAATAKDFKIFYQKQSGSKPGLYTIDHTAGLYVFDPQGRLRLFVRDGAEVANVTADLKVLLAGK